jgi:hypothetical protein
VSVDIIRFIPRPRPDCEQTDFPTIAFRSAVHDLAADQAEPARGEFCEPDKREA